MSGDVDRPLFGLAFLNLPRSWRKDPVFEIFLRVMHADQDFIDSAADAAGGSLLGFFAGGAGVSIT